MINEAQHLQANILPNSNNHKSKTLMEVAPTLNENVEKGNLRGISPFKSNLAEGD